ncbi:MAG: DNA translocase FtsK 4TM domain-containing protein [Candidatus Saccharibacteria bacterium]|nr:DNA translocase FtsK 4TM domain-containing protein [Candidatus Saccharibacteria bacterium]
MAQKKRGRKRKSAKEEAPKHELPGGFWRQALAIVFLVIAVTFVAMWFGAGQNAVFLQVVKDFCDKAFGFTTYLFPFILTYISVMIFRAPNNRVDTSVWVASTLMIFWFCGIFGVGSYGTPSNTGGVIGEYMNNFAVRNLGSGVSIMIYIVLILITALFMYAETPLALFRKIAAIFKTSKDSEDAENARIMRKNKEKDVEKDKTSDLKIVANVETVDHGAAEPKPSLFKTKGMAEVKTAPEEPMALVAVSDPNWKMPPMDLLNRKTTPADPGDTEANARIIKDTLAQFDIDVTVDGANLGPRITQYTLRPPAGIRVNKLLQYDKNLAMSLAADKIRIEAPIPRTNMVGIEVPNITPASVGLHELLRATEWRKMASEKPLAFTVGKDIAGQVVVGDLAKMPHLLIAGTTGSGKSVMTNVLISSLLYHNSPSDLKLIIVDPKQVEMAAYEDIPHLLTPVINSTDKALSAMKWAVGEMEKRYTIMSKERVKNIIDYNTKMADQGGTVTIADEDGNPQEHNNGKMPYIVVIVDEMADLMMTAGKELEMLIVRIAQKGRAAGIHLVLATQRPEVKVVTGLIKANIPGRIAFAVNNGVDSRVMLDAVGAEKLLGSGDMLFLTTEMMGKPRRVQGAFVSDKEIAKITDFLRQQAPPQYNDEVISQSVSVPGMPGSGGGSMGGGGDVERQAAEIAIRAGKLSTSLLQRQLHIGYGRAASIIDELEAKGVVGPATGGNKPRDVLITSIEEYPG